MKLSLRKKKRKSRDAYRRVALHCPKCGRSNFLTGKGLAGHRAKCGGSGAHKALSAGMARRAKARSLGRKRSLKTIMSVIAAYGFSPNAALRAGAITKAEYDVAAQEEYKDAEEIQDAAEKHNLKYHDGYHR